MQSFTLRKFFEEIKIEVGGYKVYRLKLKKKGLGKYYPGYLIARNSKSLVMEET
jgi:hypothetical protein